MKPKMNLRETTSGARPRHLLVLGALLLTGAICTTSYAADPNRGRQLYSIHCITCHGGPGITAAPGSPSFERGQGLMRPDFTLMEATRMGKNAMPAYQGVLSNRDILDIIAYMRTLH